MIQWSLKAFKEFYYFFLNTNNLWQSFPFFFPLFKWSVCSDTFPCWCIVNDNLEKFSIFEEKFSMMTDRKWTYLEQWKEQKTYLPWKKLFFCFFLYFVFHKEQWEVLLRSVNRFIYLFLPNQVCENLVNNLDSESGNVQVNKSNSHCYSALKKTLSNSLANVYRARLNSFVHAWFSPLTEMVVLKAFNSDIKDC